MDDGKLILKMNSGISVLSAFVNWKGAAMALDYQMEMSVSRGNEKENKWNIRRILSILKKQYGKDSGLQVEVERKIPTGMGLKSSSALVSGVVKAYSIFNELNMETDDIANISSRISRQIKISATGALDDIYASMIGGLCITDNRRNQLLKHYRIKEKNYIIITPNAKRSSYDFARVDLSFLRNPYNRMFQRLNSYNYEDVAVMNGFYLGTVSGIDMPGNILNRLRFNIMGINGKGPSLFLQYENSRAMDRDVDVLEKEKLNFIVGRSTNLPSSHEWKNE